MALELARGGADLKAVVGFHPGLGHSRPADAGNIRGSVLLCLGADDPVVPAEHRRAFEDEMRATTVDWRMTLYGNAQHSFTHPRLDPEQPVNPGVAYHEPSADRAWRAMLDLFDETFGAPDTWTA
jgi:dienelactone hydrolase